MSYPRTPQELAALAKDAQAGILPALDLLKEMAAAAGYEGRRGGWIYGPGSERALCRGWAAFAGILARAAGWHLDEVLGAALRLELELAEAEAERQAEKEELEPDPVEEEPTAEEALAAIGGCWAGGALTGKALKAYALGDYVKAYALAQDQKNLQTIQERDGGQEAVHPEHREDQDLDVVKPLDVVGREVLEMKVPTPRGLERDLQMAAYAQMGPGVWVAPIGTPEPTPEDLSDLAIALAAEDLEHVDPDGEKPEPAQPRCEVGDVVTIHRGDRLYEVLQVERDSLWDRVSGTREELSMARVSPCDPEDHRDPQWVNVDLLHVRPPVARVHTVEVTERVRQTREVFSLAGRERLVAIRTILVDSRRLPVATLREVSSFPAGQEPHLRVGEAVVVDGRAFQVVDPEGTGDLRLEPARHRDRLLVS